MRRILVAEQNRPYGELTGGTKEVLTSLSNSLIAIGRC